MPKYSIIICAYNVAKYLDQAVRYVTFQIFRDIEIIIVDDGSTDGITPRLCDKLAETDHRIRVIHKKNGGLGSARNAGIEAARGEYVCFYDVDDIYPLQTLKVVDKALSETPVDVLMFGYEEIYPKTERHILFKFENKTFYGDEIRENFEKEFSGLKFNNGFAWNKVYRRQFLLDNNLMFGTQAIQQDEPFNLRVYRKAASLRLISDVLYGYVIYNSGNNRSRYIPDRVEIYRSIYNEYKSIIEEWQLSDDFRKYVCRKFVNDIITALTYNLYHSDCPYSTIRKWKEISKVLSDNDVSDAITVYSSMGYGECNSSYLFYYSAIIHKSVLLFLLARDFQIMRDSLAMLYHKIIKR